MKRIRSSSPILALALLAALLVGQPGLNSLKAETESASPFVLDRSRSKIQFFVDARLVDVKGYFRSYRLDQFEYDGKNPESMKGGILIWPASVFTRDKDRDEHLRQDDFFWVEKYPTSRVSLKKVTRRQDGAYDFLFSLQIRDKVKEFTVPTKISSSGGHTYIEGSFKVDRRDFDLNGEHVANLVMDNDVELSYVIALQDTRLD
ncbi:MAG: YceI family protein [Leptospiraceae bacterium]|nr:YceI family protein [Leptospiraceae bacterium]MCB1170807.1 YceI family protein [Leptospiraceae bacterium]